MPRAKSRQRGVVSGREQSEIEPLLNATAKDAGKFAEIRGKLSQLIRNAC